MIYFTSDTHFLHNKNFCYEKRGFKNAEEMSETILTNINKTVKEDDTLFILGDIWVGSNDGINCLKKIICKNIFIILGNHDTATKIEKMYDIPNFVGMSYADIVKYGKFNFFLSHYPALTGFCPKHINNALISLFGHTHQTEKFFVNEKDESIPWMYNVGCDAHNCTPVSIEDIIKDCKEEFAKYCSKYKKETEV